MRSNFWEGPCQFDELEMEITSREKRPSNLSNVWIWRMPWSHMTTAAGRAGMLRIGEVSGAGSGELSLQCQRN